MIGFLVLLIGLVGSAIAWSWAGRSVDSANRAGLVAILGVGASAFNIIVPIPNVEATTVTVICTAVVFGYRTALTVGVVAIFATSATVGFGLWTIWQIVATFSVALLADLFARTRSGFSPAFLAAAAVLCTLVYDVVVTVPSVIIHSPGEADSIGRLAFNTLLLGAPFTIIHVLATTLLALFVGRSLINTLQRARLRLDGRVV